MYIGDTSSSTIRKIISNGIVDTFAGGDLLGIFSDAAYPYGDPSGNIYFSETSAHRVQKVSFSGILTRLAGSFLGLSGSSGDGGSTGSATLDTPRGLFVDPAGLYLFIADSGNNKIRVITLSSSIIRLFAGTGTSGNGVSVYT